MRRPQLALGFSAFRSAMLQPAHAAETLLQFNGGIGVDPVAGIPGSED